jgi:hypothetical protein
VTLLLFFILLCLPSQLVESVISMSDGLKYNTYYSGLVDTHLSHSSSIQEEYMRCQLYTGDLLPFFFLYSFVLSYILPSYSLFLVFTISLFLSAMLFLLRRYHSLGFAFLLLFFFCCSFYGFYVLLNNPRLLLAITCIIIFLNEGFLSGNRYRFSLAVLAAFFHLSSLLIWIPFIVRYLINYSSLSVTIPIKVSLRDLVSLAAIFFLIILFLTSPHVIGKVLVYQSYISVRFPTSVVISLVICICISIIYGKLRINHYLISLLLFLLISSITGPDKINPIYWTSLFLYPLIYTRMSHAIMLCLYLLLLPKTITFYSLSLQGIDFYAQ